ncbi:hypothetical protein C6P46_006513 [Rhodotorula mucilaginosa]|uniref:Uncharacterized protein n=1 Tax=Rhodotorula mucilaginosa TaxID=5537 RepID=A0A9P6VW39_RHOMI|nr:hypothetical protein C6P46_006513 [Rhodotorula mucilaginosa]
MVPPESRTRLLGGMQLIRSRHRVFKLTPSVSHAVVDVTRTLVATPGPFVTGRLVDLRALEWSFPISGGIKFLCDIALLLGLRGAKLEF